MPRRMKTPILDVHVAPTCVQKVNKNLKPKYIFGKMGQNNESGSESVNRVVADKWYTHFKQLN